MIGDWWISTRFVCFVIVIMIDILTTRILTFVWSRKLSETHLSTDLPDSIVNIPEYNLFRRDRGWLGRDKR